MQPDLERRAVGRRQRRRPADPRLCHRVRHAVGGPGRVPRDHHAGGRRPHAARTSSTCGRSSTTTPARCSAGRAAGHAALAKDARGLRVEIDPPDTTAGRDIVALVQRGDVTGMSFAFQVIAARRTVRATGRQPVRIIKDMAIQEVSIVTFPAYASTDVQVAQRALEAFHGPQQGQSIASFVGSFGRGYGSLVKSARPHT